jgi:Lysylphosphatidylglycerol synthase TM region
LPETLHPRSVHQAKRLVRSKVHIIGGPWHPTPGGLGAIEAALVAGLTGVGMQPGPAVSAVLLYRLATYWLPVLPGWLCWRSLQYRGYV